MTTKPILATLVSLCFILKCLYNFQGHLSLAMMIFNSIGLVGFTILFIEVVQKSLKKKE